MKIAISNLAWQPPDDDQVFALLREKGISQIELAPTKYFPEIPKATDQNIAVLRDRLQEAGLSVVGFQALLFGQPELKVFADKEIVAMTLDYLEKVAEMCRKLGGQVMVFGSPKNRLVPADIGREDAWKAAVDFFWNLGQRCHGQGVKVCIEPNPAAYGSNFATKSDEAARLVRDVDSPGFGLHLDLGAISLNGEDVRATIEGQADILCHFHASEPQIKPLDPDNTNHRLAAEALRDIGYEGVVSVEMLPPPAGLDDIGRVLDFVLATYGDAQASPQAPPA